MSNNKVAVALAFIIALPMTPAFGGGYGAGFGMKTCAQYAKDYAQNPNVVGSISIAWAQGLMSGLNLAFGSAFHKSYQDLEPHGNVAGQEAYFREYCDAHPLALFADAVFNFYKTLPRLPLSTK